MAEAVYILCALTSGLCTVLLTRGWLATHVRLLLWSAICFAILTVNNLLLVVDLVFLDDDADLSTARAATGLAGLLVLLYALVYDRESGGA
jgi:Family of unknown function (DUF5985)